ncbi:hypothetical protein EQG49_00275 [Periweissella cryptocerci]|uniref:IrrE N-terminal-like domain-containing protein n=1 Tax=Periweissella cryptocerci TaxID=2506420 RepID=A0A4P6YQU8_9LACO|nr:toprim domain-containing protein [Periweissella cryptocerci]QBO34990.1 hypothetical protein EQG49_00275 [Periweissella cryptocerci]
MGKMTDEEKQYLKSLPIVSYMEQRGIPFEKFGRNAVKVLPHGGFDHHTVVINTQTNWYHWNSRGTHGDLVKFIEMYENVDQKEALRIRMEFGNYAKDKNIDIEGIVRNAQADVPREDFNIAKYRFDNNTDHVRDYLINERGYSPKFTDGLIKVGLVKQGFKRKDTDSGEVLNPEAFFLWQDPISAEIKGADRQGTTIDYEKFGKRGAEKRIAYSSDSDSGYNLHYGTGRGTLYAFESPHDLNAYAMMNGHQLKQENAHLLSISGTPHYKKILSYMDHYYGDMDKLPKIVFAMDNDLEGREVASRFNAIEFKDKSGAEVEFEVHVPPIGMKDWNDALKAKATSYRIETLEENELVVEQLQAEREARDQAQREQAEEYKKVQKKASKANDNPFDDVKLKEVAVVALVAETTSEYVAEKSIEQAKVDDNDSENDYLELYRANAGRTISNQGSVQITPDSFVTTWDASDESLKSGLFDILLVQNNDYDNAEKVGVYDTNETWAQRERAARKAVDNAIELQTTTKDWIKLQESGERAQVTTQNKEVVQAQVNKKPAEKEATLDTTTKTKKQTGQEIIDDAMKRVEQFSNNPKDIKELLDFYATQYDYSPRNLALAKAQYNGATYISSMKRLNDAGLKIRKGEKAIRILGQPSITKLIVDGDKVVSVKKATPAQKAKAESGELKTFERKTFKSVNVFDISQTDARDEDLPKLLPNKPINFKKHVSDDDLQNAYSALKAYAVTNGVPVIDNQPITDLHGAKGYYKQSLDGNAGSIAIRPDIPLTDKFSVLAHEIGHVEMHNVKTGDQSLTAPQKEFQAEMVSYVVSKHFGIDTDEHAVGYIANWTQNGEKLDDKAKLIEKVGLVSRQINKAVDGKVNDANELTKTKEQTKEKSLTPKKTKQPGQYPRQSTEKTTSKDAELLAPALEFTQDQMKQLRFAYEQGALGIDQRSYHFESSGAFLAFLKDAGVNSQVVQRTAMKTTKIPMKRINHWAIQQREDEIKRKRIK